jgi:hypothetical protein
MLRRFSCTVALAVAAAFVCQLALASAPDEGTPAPNRDVQKEAPAKRHRPLYLSLPDSVVHAFRHPVQQIRSWFSRDHAKRAAADKNGQMNSSVPAQAAFPGRETRPRASMYIGMAPPAVPSDEPGPYRQNALAADANGCGNADNSHVSNGPPDTSERDARGPLLNGLSVGLCMKF